MATIDKITKGEQEEERKNTLSEICFILFFVF